MDVQNVFDKMLDHYQQTGSVMQNDLFVKEIADQFETGEIIDGILQFNQYLDEQRKVG